MQSTGDLRKAGY